MIAIARQNNRIPDTKRSVNGSIFNSGGLSTGAGDLVQAAVESVGTLAFPRMAPLEAVKVPCEGAGLLSCLVDSDGVLELADGLTRVEPGQIVDCFYICLPALTDARSRAGRGIPNET